MPGLGRSPGEGKDNPQQYSCLGNSMDRGAWQATVREVAKSQNITEHTHCVGQKENMIWVRKLKYYENTQQKTDDRYPSYFIYH